MIQELRNWANLMDATGRVPAPEKLKELLNNAAAEIESLSNQLRAGRIRSGTAERLNRATDDLIAGRPVTSETIQLMCDAAAELEARDHDKERLDWMEKQSTLAMWQGVFSHSDYNIKLGRAGAPICTLSTMDADGTETGKEIAGANTLRHAIDAAMEGAKSCTK